MNSPRLSRRSFVRMLAGLLAFVPVAKSLTTSPFKHDADLPRITSKEDLKETLKARIAKGVVLALEGNSIWIHDRYVDDKLRLVITDESVVWKGKYNKGNGFGSYSYSIDPGDDAIALGQRQGNEFVVEKMYANIVNIYVTVNEISVEGDAALISYTDASTGKGTVRITKDHLVNQAVHNEIVNRRQQLLDTKVQIIGLPLKDGTVVAANVLYG